MAQFYNSNHELEFNDWQWQKKLSIILVKKMTCFFLYLLNLCSLLLIKNNNQEN